MKPHPRIRKTIKWGGAVVTVLLVVVWIGSGWCNVGVAAIGPWYAHALWGRIEIVYSPGAIALPLPLSIERARTIRWAKDGSQPEVVAVPYTLIWLADASWGGANRSCCVPLHWPAAAGALITIAAWRLDTLARRSARLNLCPKCHYDRTGLARDAKCPECGSGAVHG